MNSYRASPDLAAVWSGWPSARACVAKGTSLPEVGTRCHERDAMSKITELASGRITRH
jgi:hypothetical protein